MDYSLQYETVIARCRMLSGFEGRDAVDASGRSDFLRILITSQDEPVLLSCVSEGARIAGERFSRLLSSSEYSDSGFSWTFRSESTRCYLPPSFDRNIQEALVGYAMSRWLSDKNPSRTDLYRSIWDNMLQLCVDGVFRKSAPRKFRKSDREGMQMDIDEEEVSVE